jgi:hypothetical protein
VVVTSSAMVGLAEIKTLAAAAHANILTIFILISAFVARLA